MYRYDAFDHRLVQERVAQFRDQTRRFLIGGSPRTSSARCGCRTDSTSSGTRRCFASRFPTGCSRPGCAKLAHVSRRYDRGYGHFSTRQNLQLNWPRLEDVPDILAELATVEMHAQTSGNDVQHHQRPFRRCRARRGRRPAPVLRARPAMGGAPSGVRLPAAQVQDRRHRCGQRPHGRVAARRGARPRQGRRR